MEYARRGAAAVVVIVAVAVKTSSPFCRATTRTRCRRPSGDAVRSGSAVVSIQQGEFSSA